MAAAAQNEVDEVDVVDGAEVGAAGLVLPAVRVEVHVAEGAEHRGRHGHAALLVQNRNTIGLGTGCPRLIAQRIRMFVSNRPEPCNFQFG